MHICQDEINALLMAVPFVGVGLAVPRTWWKHGVARLRGRKEPK